MRLRTNKGYTQGEDVRLVDMHDQFETEIGSDRLTSQIGSDDNTWMCRDGKHPR